MRGRGRGPLDVGRVTTNEQGSLLGRFPLAFGWIGLGLRGVLGGLLLLLLL